MNDQDFIKRCFELASQGLGRTWPNPLVGCVIVKNHKIIAEGFHQKAGEDHAEIAAIKNATESLEGSTVYVNLEPCCHTHKRTPPCAQRLIQEKVKRVIISNLDPNPAVNGQGVEMLRSHGIEVEYGILNEFGEKLNEVFFHAQRNQKPFVFLKMASTLDGKTAMPDGTSRWITGPVARGHVHLLRSQHQAVMVGAQTLRQDDPELNVRLPHYAHAQPHRIVFTQSGQIPQTAKILNDEEKSKTLIITTSNVSLPFPTEQIIRIQHLSEAMDKLFERKFINLFLEGGSLLASVFMREKLINRIGLFLNPSFLGTGKGLLHDLEVRDLNHRPRLTHLESQWLGEDLYMTGKLCSPDSSKN